MSTKTAVPIVKNVKRPTILQPKVQARKTPVAHIQLHHWVENSLGIDETGWIARNDTIRTDIEPCGNECTNRVPMP